MTWSRVSFSGPRAASARPTASTASTWRLRRRRRSSSGAAEREPARAETRSPGAAIRAGRRPRSGRARAGWHCRACSPDSRSRGRGSRCRRTPTDQPPPVRRSGGHGDHRDVEAPAAAGTDASPVVVGDDRHEQRREHEPESDGPSQPPVRAAKAGRRPSRTVGTTNTAGSGRGPRWTRRRVDEMDEDGRVPPGRRPAARAGRPRSPGGASHESDRTGLGLASPGDQRRHARQCLGRMGHRAISRGSRRSCGIRTIRATRTERGRARNGAADAPRRPTWHDLRVRLATMVTLRADPLEPRLRRRRRGHHGGG